MVERFVIRKGIDDERVVQAMLQVPRHRFVQPALIHQAYDGKALPIGYGQTISHPTTVALMCALLAVSPGERVLEVGTGSGYNAAVLAQMGVKVFSIERIGQLVRKARRLLAELGYHSVAVRQGDGATGWPEFAPFQGIVITAACRSVPKALLEQLSEEGRMILPLGTTSRQKLTLIQRTGGEFFARQMGEHRFVPLIGKQGWPGE
ncbi:MAG: protein-L-isoaspartate(D-aspartate) O-methyltransferase [Calditrichaeota bacterium]|nr:MAG: protein-L-isoaspartate(D-aspartate) O-methyltransferase [Calditrichota bacterium]